MLAHLQNAQQFRVVMQASRLRSQSSGVFRSGHLALHFLGSSALAAQYFEPDEKIKAWLGVIASKREAKRAVTRNTIKRLFYAQVLEIVQKQGMLHSGAYVLRLHCALKKPEFISATSPQLKQVLRAEIQSLFQRLERHVFAPTTD